MKLLVLWPGKAKIISLNDSLNNYLKYLLLGGFLIAMLGISVRYSPIWYDDAGHYIVAKHYNDTGVMGYPVFRFQEDEEDFRKRSEESPFVTMGPTLSYPGAYLLSVFGLKMIPLRILIAFLTLVFLFVFWGLARSMIGEKKAFWALLLVGGNIQLLTYGAEFLGETPMLLGLFGGFWALKKQLEGGKVNPFLLVFAVGSFLFAILTKEYIMATIGVGLLLSFFWFIKKSRKPGVITFLIVGSGVLVGYLIFHFFRVGSYENGVNWFIDRLSYSSEFFAFDFVESLRFLAFKPLILLGLIALIVKIAVRREPWDTVMGIFFGGQLILFLLSAGYDRFGFQLLFVPAIYLAEFASAAWDRLGDRKGKWILRTLFSVVFIGLFTQQTIPVFANRILHPERINQHEKCVAKWLVHNEKTHVFTFDQTLVPFLPANIQYRLPDMVPSQAVLLSRRNRLNKYFLTNNEVFVEGEYGRTNYHRLLYEKDLILFGKHQCGPQEEGYTIYEYDSFGWSGKSGILNELTPRSQAKDFGE